MNTRRLAVKPLLPLVTAAVSLALATAAHAQTADTYNDPAPGQLTIPSLIIGSADFENLVVTVTGLVAQPTGSYAFEFGDFYDTTNNDLIIAAVTLGATTYYNPVVSIGGVVSIGNVDGAATYANGTLFLPAVQIVGGPLYNGVSATISAGQVKSIGGGMPTVSQNTYDPSTGLLTIPVIEYNNRFYTNVVTGITLSEVSHVVGHEGLDTVVYSFTGNADGANPGTTLIQGADGNLYGTTADGGGAGYGTVFRVSPQGAPTVLYTFTGTGNDGAYPGAGLVEDGQGNFYGTTTAGGSFGNGVVFEIAANGTESTLYSFGTAPTDGAYPNGLVLAADGNLYGTTANGGGTADLGTVYKVTITGGGAPTLTTLHTFAGSPTDGAYPYASLIQARDGFLYGTTFGGGSQNSGAIFRISTTGSPAMLYSFAGGGAVAAGTDGVLPGASLTQAADGTLYGTTEYGGTNGVGSVFAFNPSTLVETQVYSFAGSGGVPGSADGAYPFTGVIIGTDGNLYGTAPYGGAYNEGTVYQLTTSGTATTLYSFNGDDALAGSSDAAYPNAVIQASDGNLYGTAYDGGTSNAGAVFKLAP